MDKMIVTVVGPDRRAEVAVPPNAPIADLLPGLAEVCVRRSPGEEPEANGGYLWAIGRPGDESFPEASSLADCGVLEGEVLELRGVAHSVADALAPATDQAGPTEAAKADTQNDPATEPTPSAAAVEEAEPLVAPDALAALTMAEVGGAPIALGAAAEAPLITPPAAPPPPPLVRTREALPPRTGFNARLGRASGALMTPPSITDELIATSPEEVYRPPTPRELSRRRAPSPLQRARRAWRATDYRRQLDVAITAPRLARCATIAVLSPKGGVGKTTVAALLGELFALVRRDRILAIDTNPDFGSLGRTLTPDHGIYVDDLLEYLEHPALSVTALDSSLGRAAHGLMVLPSPADPERMERLDQDAYARVIHRLQDLVGVIMLDCGTGLQDPATRAAIAAADQLIVVSDSEPATATLVAEACRLLESAEKPLTLVVNKMRGRGNRLDINSFAAHVPHARALVVIPDEQAAAIRLVNGEFTWGDAPIGWQRAVRELATVIVAGWKELEIAA